MSDLARVGRMVLELGTDRLHDPGCPAVADDEGDQVLDDYGRCACDALDVMTVVDRQRARIAELEAERDALRAVLWPQLDSPTYDSQDEAGGAYIACRFCTMRLYWREPMPTGVLHDADCPVLRRDELLGRI